MIWRIIAGSHLRRRHIFHRVGLTSLPAALRYGTVELWQFLNSTGSLSAKLYVRRGFIFRNAVEKHDNFMRAAKPGLYKLPQFEHTVIRPAPEFSASRGELNAGMRVMAGSEGLYERPQQQMQSGDFAAEADVRVFQVSGFVKWFDVTRGYGFIIPDTGLPDVLLHLSCLKRDGYEAPLEGTRVLCEAVERPKGIQALRVLSVDASTAIHPVERTPRTHVQVTASSDWTKVKVKWFNRARGFGFLTEGEGCPDIFVHMEVLRRTAIAELQPDETVYVRFGTGPKGLMAAEVRTSLDDDRLPRTN